jgi:hypothetical protein
MTGRALDIHRAPDVLDRLGSGNRDTYGSIAACKRVVGERSGPMLENVRIDGARETGATANARATLPDGGSGDLQLRRVGDAWRVDGYDDGLRHALAAYLTFEQLRMTASKPGLNADGARECVVQRLDDMPDDRVGSYIYAAVGERGEGADEELESLIVGCLTDPRSGRGGESYLRPYFVQDTVAAARGQDYTDAELRCFERKLEAFTDEEIAEHVSRDKANPPPSTVRMGEALMACDG